MCGILVESSFKKPVDYIKFIEATNTLYNRGPDEFGCVFAKHFSLGHRRLSVIDIENGKQPMSILKHHMVYNGELYNTNELRVMLEKQGVKIESHSDTEVVLKSYLHFKEKCLNLMNGIFAFAVVDNNSIFAARDFFGVKPLYYTIYQDEIIVASEIKAILKLTGEAIVDVGGLQELLGMGPSHSEGRTPFKNIYELKPGHYLKYNKIDGLVIEKYYDVTPLENKLSKEECIKHVKELVTDACIRQTVSDVPLACFLSGGLDSSIISLIVAKVKPELSTFSIDYEGNQEIKEFNKFETSNDQDFIGYVVEKGNLKHKTCRIDLNTLQDALKTVVILRDYPGMTDIDASMFWLAKNIKKTHTVALSGECADEIFGGYPWFYRNDGEVEVFPWIRNIDYREGLLKKSVREKLGLKKYVLNRFESCKKETPILATDSKERILERQMSYLNLKYFMTTLLERKDRMTMGASLEVRVPFADKRLIEFMYNVPFEYKYFDGHEKAILREAFKDILPKEIYQRKKSPYPKSRSTKFLEMMQELLKTALLDSNSKLYDIFDEEKLWDLVYDKDELETPWFGQLMRKPQLIAFLYQLDFWFKEYNIILDLGEK